MILKLLFVLFSVVILFQTHQVYADDEELPPITIDFVTGDVIDLNETPQLIRADVKIENFDSQVYYSMQVIRISDREVLKESLIYPRVIEDNLYGVQISHYIEPGANEEDLIGDYVLRIYSKISPESGSEFVFDEAYMPFSIVKPSIPITTQNAAEESDVENQMESKIPSWVHNIFVWYAEETISEDELLTALEYLISQDIINVNSN